MNQVEAVGLVLTLLAGASALLLLGAGILLGLWLLAKDSRQAPIEEREHV